MQPGEKCGLALRVPALLLAVALAAGPLACRPPRLAPAAPRATPEEILRWSELSKSGRGHLRFGRYQEAEEDLGAALEISRSYRPSDVRRRSSIGNLRQLAVAYWNAGRPEDFARVMERVMPACREVPASQTSAMADTLIYLGAVCRQEGELATAREALEFALAIRLERVGERDLGVGEVRAELGRTWIEIGDLDRAEQEITAAMDIAEEDVGREHPVFARLLTVLSSLREAQGRMEDAEAELQRAVQINRAAAGPSHRETVNAMAELAQFYRRADRLADAETTLEEIVTVYREADEGGPPHLQSLSDLARFHVETGDPGKAENEARQALEIFESKNAVGPLKAAVLETLALSLQHQKRYAESEKRYLEAAAEARPKAGAPADQLEEIAARYAELLRQLGRGAETEGLLERLREAPPEAGPGEAKPAGESEAAGAGAEGQAETPQAEQEPEPDAQAEAADEPEWRSGADPAEGGSEPEGEPAEGAKSGPGGD